MASTCSDTCGSCLRHLCGRDWEDVAWGQCGYASGSGGTDRERGLVLPEDHRGQCQGGGTPEGP